MKKIPYDKLQALAEIVIPKIVNKIIVDTDDGYIVYNTYYIKKNKSFYNVLRRGDDKNFQFFQLKHAIAWSILDSKYLMHEALKVHEIDNLLVGLDFERKIHTKLQKRGNLESYLIQTAKLQSVLYKQTALQRELDKYIKVAKLCQQKGFENEINRTKRK